jgi:hypothetical protein
MRPDGQRDVTNLIVALRNFAKAPKIADAFQSSCIMAHAVSRRPLTVEVPGSYETIGGQSGNGTGFSPSISGVPCQYHATHAPYSSTS